MRRQPRSNGAHRAFASAIPAHASEIYGGVIPPDVFTAPPAFAPPRVYNWTGVYIGINAGGSWSSSDWAEDPWAASPMGGSYTLSGALIGGTIGYNLQAGTSSFVVGMEADFAWSNIKGTTPAFTAQVVSFPGPFPSAGPATITPTPGCTPNCEINSPWFATARLRFLFIAAKIWRHSGRTGISFSDHYEDKGLLQRLMERLRAIKSRGDSFFPVVDGAFV